MRGLKSDASFVLTPPSRLSRPLTLSLRCAVSDRTGRKLDEVEIGLSGVTGSLSFLRDSTNESVLRVESIWINNERPGPQSLSFSDPTVTASSTPPHMELPLRLPLEFSRCLLLSTPAWRLTRFLGVCLTFAIRWCSSRSG